MINGTPDAAPAPAPERRGPAVASAEEPAPAQGAAGVTRSASAPNKRPHKVPYRPIFDRENDVNGLPAEPPA